MKRFFYFLFSLWLVLGVVTSCRQEKNTPEKHDEQVSVDTVLVMHITYKVKPDRIMSFKNAFNQCAIETLKEPGCLAYEVYQSYNDSTMFFLLEKWQNRQAHQRHCQTEHIKAYFKAIDGAFDQGGSFELIRIPPSIDRE